MFLSNFDNINITLETGTKCKLRVDKMFKKHIVHKDLVALEGGAILPHYEAKKVAFHECRLNAIDSLIISCLRQSYI